MADLKLGKLPDRIPVKHTIVVMPELEQKLRDYADLYRQSYSETESIEALIPFMLEAFLRGDKAFIKARKTRASLSSNADANKKVRLALTSNETV